MLFEYLLTICRLFQQDHWLIVVKSQEKGLQWNLASWNTERYNSVDCEQFDVLRAKGSFQGTGGESSLCDFRGSSINLQENRQKL